MNDHKNSVLNETVISKVGHSRKLAFSDKHVSILINFDYDKINDSELIIVLFSLVKF